MTDIPKRYKELCDNWFKSDLDIEIGLKDKEGHEILLIWESNVYYNHYPDGTHERKKGDKRRLHVENHIRKKPGELREELTKWNLHKNTARRPKHIIDHLKEIKEVMKEKYGHIEFD